MGVGVSVGRVVGGGAAGDAVAGCVGVTEGIIATMGVDGAEVGVAFPQPTISSNRTRRILLDWHSNALAAET